MITIYGKDNCTFCEQSKALLISKGIDFEYKLLGIDFEKDEFIEMMRKEFNVIPRSMPQIVFDSEYVGGFTELKQKLS